MGTTKKELTLGDFKTLFKDVYPSLCVFGNKFLNDLDLVKDMVQEVFIKVWEDGVTFQDQNHVQGYLFKAVKNACLNVLKSKRYRNTERLELNDLDIEDIQVLFKMHDEAFKATDILWRAIERLPDKASEVIRLSLQDYSNLEIADTLGISVNTVKDHKKVAYKKLRQFLKGLA